MHLSSVSQEMAPKAVPISAICHLIRPSSWDNIVSSMFVENIMCRTSMRSAVDLSNGHCLSLQLFSTPTGFLPFTEVEPTQTPSLVL